jgi:MFS family permease
LPNSLRALLFFFASLRLCTFALSFSGIGCNLVKRPLDFISITIADFIVRSAYQMGKTPLLPIFATTLGATGAFLGFIVSVSTLTGIVLKPIIGILSDRWGRRWWLIVGTSFFAGMPFLYRFIHSPEHLLGIRVVHGLATAIYGPVTLAFVVEQTETKRAEQLGWFGMARHAGYIVGPAVAGWLLLTMEAVSVFTIIGMLSILAFVPILYLKEPASSAATLLRKTGRPALYQQTDRALKFGMSTPAVWLSGGLESTVFIALYAAKAFLPIYALELGISVALVGTFFAFQEAIHLVLKPFGGRLGDAVGYLKSIFTGIILMGIALCLLTIAHGPLSLMALAALIGGAQALVFPSTVALVSTQISEQHIGAGMGFIGMLKNSGKVAGPILGGLLIHWLDFIQMFRFMGILLLVGAGLVWYGAKVLQNSPSQ